MFVGKAGACQSEALELDPRVEHLKGATLWWAKIPQENVRLD